MKTLYGYKQPRLVYLTPTTESVIGAVEFYGDGYIDTDKGSPQQSMVNTAVYGENSSGEETWSRITRVSGSKIYHTGFSNGLPAKRNNIVSKYTVYDLPYTQSPLIETYQPDFIVHQLYNGTKETTIRGWWYSVVLDYGKKLTPTQLQYFEDTFDNSRTTEIRLYPRKDNYQIYFTVEPDPETLIQLANRPFWNGHRFFKVKLNGTTRLSSINLSPTGFGIITETGDILTDESGTIISEQ